MADTDVLLRAQIILQEEMCKERSPIELLRWIDDFHETISTSEEDRKKIRLATGHVKLLFEEVRPLALFGRWFAQRYPGLTVQPMANKERGCDGILRHPDWREEQAVEVTLAVNGYQEHLRMLHLNEFGRAPAAGEIDFGRRSGRPYPVETSGTAHAVHERRAIIYRLIREAAERKRVKSYAHKTWLLIVFDDYLGFSIGEKLRDEAVTEFESFFRDSILAMPWTISAVYAIGSSGRLVAGGQISQK